MEYEVWYIDFIDILVVSEFRVPVGGLHHVKTENQATFVNSTEASDT